MMEVDSQNTNFTRNFLKCNQCRRDAKKCAPTHRDWQYLGQKCVRCLHLGHPCGPPERKARVTKVGRSDIEEDEAPHDTQSWTLNTADERGVLALDPSVTSPTSSHFSTHIDIDKLATIVSVLEIVLLNLLCCNKTARNPFVDRARVCDLQEFLLRLKQHVCSTFETTMSTVERNLFGTTHVEKQLLTWKIMYLRERYSYVAQTIASLHDNDDIPRRSPNPINLLQHSSEGRILACTSRMLSSIQSNSAFSAGMFQLRMYEYTAFHGHLSRLMDELGGAGSHVFSNLVPGHPASTQGISRALPASHIAYWNQDKKVALELWKNSLPYEANTDVLGRSFLHLAAASCDLYTMQKIEEHRADAVQIASHDYLGLYPHQLVGGPHATAVIDWFFERLRPAPVVSYRQYNPPTPFHLAQRPLEQGLRRAAMFIYQDQHMLPTSTNALADLENLDIGEESTMPFGTTSIATLEVTEQYLAQDIISSGSSGFEEHETADQYLAHVPSDNQYQASFRYPYGRVNESQFPYDGNVDPFSENNWSE